jgi:YggT family protein
MLEPFNQAVKFLTQTLVELYILLVCLRVIFHWANVSHANPILLNIGRVTYPCLRPIYNLLPPLKGIDLAAVILLSSLSMSKIGMLFWWQTGYIPPLTGLALLAFAEILKQFIDIFFFMSMLFGLMSWFNPFTSPAVVEIVLKISSPLWRLAQGLLPRTSGIDFSPLLVIIGLKLLTILIVGPLSQIGIELMKATVN